MENDPRVLIVKPSLSKPAEASGRHPVLIHTCRLMGKNGGKCNGQKEQESKNAAGCPRVELWMLEDVRGKYQK
jgi:hypothetical protein